MKVNMAVNVVPKDNYYNIEFDPNRQNAEDYIKCNILDLSPLLDANEVTEMLAGDSLDYVPIIARQKALSQWLTRIAHNGFIVLEGVDFQEVSRLIHLGQLDVNKANQIVYGRGRKSFCGPETNIQMALGTGQFVVDCVKFNGFMYTVVLKRK